MSQIIKPKSISGFPEWLPAERYIELKWFDTIREIFESYGFCSIETPSVEALEVLTAKGEVDKEIYVIERLHKEDGEKEARLALHFDQTVPMARYVAQNFNELKFPFKRYQMQRVWRGERPQAGRFREFYQCDIDVINVDNLPLYFDAECPAIMVEILQKLDIGSFKMQLNNRKILAGFCQALGIDDFVPVTRIVDKLEKIGADNVKKQLLTELSLSDAQANQILSFASIKSSDDGFAKAVRDLGVSHPTLDEGIDELVFVINTLNNLVKGNFEVDMSIVRGLDYYTGTVYETRFTDAPSYGSICSGGRYEDLAGNYINKKLPGVGISIGFSRLFDYIRAQGKLPKGRQSPADMLIVLFDESQRLWAIDLAKQLRNGEFLAAGRKMNVEIYHSATKLKKQLSYASEKGIPYVVFPPADPGGMPELKFMDDPDRAQEALTKLTGF